jgi:hypothetical protein
LHGRSRPRPPTRPRPVATALHRAANTIRPAVIVACIDKTASPSVLPYAVIAVKATITTYLQDLCGWPWLRSGVDRAALLLPGPAADPMLATQLPE